MKAPLLLHLLFQGVLLYVALGWEVRMPKHIHGLKGSCLVIPCSFSYTSYTPKNPRRIVWYQYSSGYPLVYDPLHPNDVIEKFRGKTDLYGDPSSGNCSLLIQNLEPSHHGEKLYAWIDPENVGKGTYKFYEVTSTIQVDDSPQQPSILIYGGERTGDTITVVCSTLHTCPYSKPNITLNGIEGTDQIDNEQIKDGLWKITLTRTGVVKAEYLTIWCSITHYGGITVTAARNASSLCVHHNITIEPELADVTEGVAKNFICSVYHSCQNEHSAITWNYENMQVSEWSNKISGLNQAAYSNITFLGAKEDHGKKLVCTASFSGRDIMASVVLNVQSIFHNKADPVLAELKTIGLYILTPSLAFLLACIIAGVIIYKKRQRSKDAMSQNKPFSKPRMPSPKSDPKSRSAYDHEAEYTNMDELNMYGNI
ncbi:sialoadhesin-like isoform X2 [Labeo rohita]|uniref:sialoadhesin-like isoform X2 n=1 Tax=Labeo rohita TaxID=84645 RepID=UPI0021E28B81|nr:sialoadhesin-like isoform X2 [Labeo rohita]